MLRPFKSEPLLVPKVWGGRLLEQRFGKQLPDTQPYGESWEVADLIEGQSRVATGPHRGATLGELVERYGESLVGEGFERFPLLIKILDAKTDLSLQVHPGPGDLERHPGAHLKDESWIFLHVDGVIYHGVEEGVEEVRFRDAISSGDVMELMRQIAPNEGDAIRVSPGTMHAIGAGVALLEIQTPSDTTYRVWDHGRLGMDGEPRELHLEQAIDVARFENDEALRPRKSGTLVDVGMYQIDRVVEARDYRSEGRALVVINVGSETIPIDELELAPFETAIVPASFDGAIRVEGEAVVCWAKSPTL